MKDISKTDNDSVFGKDDKYISDLVRVLSRSQPGPEDLPAMQGALNKFFGLKGSQYREKLRHALEICWYAFACDDGTGWYHGGNKALIKIDELLGCEVNEFHVNHCCALGLRYQKGKIKKLDER